MSAAALRIVVADDEFRHSGLVRLHQTRISRFSGAQFAHHSSMLRIAPE